MNKYLAWAFFMVCFVFLFSQQKGKQNIHYHKNKRISTIEVWDKDKLNGKFFCMNAKGDTLIIYHLRRYAGHSSVEAEYYSNGQAKKIELSSAPDGGIQFYREFIYFDEQGRETSRTDLSYPYELKSPIRVQPTRTISIPLPKDKTTLFYIANETAKDIKIKVVKNNRGYTSRIKLDTIISVLPNTSILIDSVQENYFVVPKNNYGLSIISNTTSKILSPEEELKDNNRKEWTWYVVRNR